MTEKANELKKIESLKEAKRIQKEQLAKKYDEMIENSKPKDQPLCGDMPPGREIKPKEDIKPKEEPKPIKKKRIIKKVIYQEASSSDSDDADEVEVVKVKKSSSKNKNIENASPQKPQENINNSYSNLLYESSIDNLKNRMMNERARALVMSVMPNYG